MSENSNSLGQAMAPKTLKCLSTLQPLLDEYFHSGDALRGSSRRLFHGRGGCYPDLQWCVIDVYHPTILVTVFDQPPDGFEQALTDLICGYNEFKNQLISALVVQYRYLPDAPHKWWVGSEPERAYAKRGDLNFHIRFSRKNIGFFLDMEPGRVWLEQRAAGKSVLNLFAYTCAFSVVAHAAGAKKIVNVDMSSQALTTGRRNHQLNNQSTDTVQFLDLDILKSWSRIRKPGPYDVIIIDPPSFQKGSFVATKDYAKVVRRIHEFAAPGTDILACLNAPELDVEFLKGVFEECCPQCEFRGRLPWSADFQDVDEQRQLKLLHFSYVGDDSAHEH